MLFRNRHSHSVVYSAVELARRALQQGWLRRWEHVQLTRSFLSGRELSEAGRDCVRQALDGVRHGQIQLTD